MPDWSDTLCEALDQQEPGLAQACQLTRGASGPLFEENLGLLLRWQQVRHLEERFAGLGGGQVGAAYNEQLTARQNTGRRMGIVLETLNRTLYEQFGLSRVDDEKARNAYGMLIQELTQPELIVATTNYDRSAEVALATGGNIVDSGFPAVVGRTPILQAAGLVRNRGARLVVLHLHGAVGWYERNGNVEDHYADQPYNATLGTPVVLYPDPEKDPTGDTVVSQLWMEFHEALEWSDHVLVLGHSLNDPALVRELQDASNTQIAVSYRDDASAEEIINRLKGATPVRIDFGPEPDIDRVAVSGWRDA
jgi:hypothetical protein